MRKSSRLPRNISRPSGWRGSEALHHGEAEPLDTKLGDTQEPSSALEAAHDLTARHICARSWEDQYVGERACSGSRAEEDEVWRDALGSSACDDPIVLREVGYEDSEEEEAVSRVSFQLLDRSLVLTWTALD